MDWPNNDACLGDNTAKLRRIFKYDPHPSRVIRIVSRNGYQAEVWSLESHEDWVTWLNRHADRNERGLVLILADRTDGDAANLTTYRRCSDEKGEEDYSFSIEDWLVRASDARPCVRAMRRETTFAPLGEESARDHMQSKSASAYQNRPRSLFYVPFSQQTFEQICKRFQVHESILRTLARSDVPSFTCDRVDMDGPVIVYSCRSPNSWDSDLAMSATHYVQKGLTFAILYGSSIKVEKTILERLRNVKDEAAHPMLLPGIFAELELVRHTGLVDININEVEAKIFELDLQSSDPHRHRQSDIDKRNHSKREAWLNLSYLRNSITTWNTQLLRMVEHAASLNDGTYASPSYSIPFPSYESLLKPKNGRRSMQIEHRIVTGDNNTSAEFLAFLHLKTSYIDHPSQNDDYEDEVMRLTRMRTIGDKIKTRLIAIRDDYEEKIRDCNMRVDGMAMSTQWSQGETAVEIASGTNQDSKVMRSISLVTMVFLPGTFFATVFSMTFFNWSGDSGKTRVSKYLWIYVVVTVVFTAITIGLWYFFVLFRRNGTVRDDEEKLRLE